MTAAKSADWAPIGLAAKLQWVLACQMLRMDHISNRAAHLMQRNSTVPNAPPHGGGGKRPTRRTAHVSLPPGAFAARDECSASFGLKCPPDGISQAMLGEGPNLP